VVFAGAVVLALPFYLLSKWLLIIQALAALKIFAVALRLFSTWEDKNRKITVLLGKNRDDFRPDTFGPFMQAPCSRLLVRYVLMVLRREQEYRGLLKMKKPFMENLRGNCAPVQTVVYINENEV